MRQTPPPDTPVAGVDERSYFARTIRHGAATLDRKRMEDDTVAAARRLVATHPDLGAIVLECANMPPYRAAVAEATGLPVFDAANLVAWFHAALGGPAGDAVRAAAGNRIGPDQPLRQPRSPRRTR